MTTYTYVRYFSDDSPGMAELQAAYRALEKDFNERKQHMDTRAVSAVERRLEVLRHAWAMLLEPVPKPWGG